METKACKTCGAEKELSLFPRTKRTNGTYYYYPNCKDCSKPSKSKTQSKYYQNNRKDISDYHKDRYHNNIEDERARNKKYKQENKEQTKIKRNDLMRRKRAEDQAFRIKSNISRRIRGILKQNNSSKKGSTILNYLKYTMEDLKKHLEKQFDSWMTWDNYGVYKKLQWDDNDSSTWTWQIDHIIPQSELQYSSMEEDNFIKCWSLENLRPLSGKDNFNRGIDLLKGRKL